MSRRSEPAPLPVQRRVVDGVLYIGSDAWASCSFCGHYHDPGEFLCCPVCHAIAADTEQQHRAAMAAWALDQITQSPGSVH